jgi:Cation efflux family
MPEHNHNSNVDKDASGQFPHDQDESTMPSLVSAFAVPKMDCPSEEQMIRMALGDIAPPVILEFDTPNRRMCVFHSVDVSAIEERLSPLGLGAKLIETRQAHSDVVDQAALAEREADVKQASILKWLLAINAIMFGLEFFVGIMAQSTGLIADSLDMFADAAVYGVALYAVGRSVSMKVRAAHLAGWLQILLALGALSEVIRRFVFGSEPESTLMMSFGVIALIANVLCLVLIAKSKDEGAHMKASWIFSANDVIANVGVVIAGFLVALTASNAPDLIIGLIIAAIVLNGGRRILKLQS